MSAEVFAARAEALLGAPYRLHGRDPATGLDCVGLVAAARGDGLATPCGYGLRTIAIERYLGFASGAGFAPADGAAFRRGDLVLAIPGPAQHHLLIALAAERFIHAHAGLRRVALHCGPLPWPIEAHWRLQPDKD